MYNCIDPVLRMFPKSEWLTVGDFYYGTDAQYLQSKGHKTVASDIDDYFLKKGKEMGYIENYSRENVESLSFKDESFDFVLCKETFHHLPRPYLGLYEMLRVSKIGIILIEPYDRLMNASFIEKICMWILKKIKGNMEELYEPSGNYKYSISLREIEKIALGRLEKYYQEVVLLEQTFIKDSGKTIKDYLSEPGNSSGKPIGIKRFLRFHLGEEMK